MWVEWMRAFEFRVVTARLQRARKAFHSVYLEIRLGSLAREIGPPQDDAIRREARESGRMYRYVSDANATSFGSTATKRLLVCGDCSSSMSGSDPVRRVDLHLSENAHLKRAIGSSRTADRADSVTQLCNMVDCSTIPPWGIMLRLNIC